MDLHLRKWERAVSELPNCITREFRLKSIYCIYSIYLKNPIYLFPNLKVEFWENVYLAGHLQLLCLLILKILECLEFLSYESSTIH